MGVSWLTGAGAASTATGAAGGGLGALAAVKEDGAALATEQRGREGPAGEGDGGAGPQ